MIVSFFGWLAREVSLLMRNADGGVPTKVKVSDNSGYSNADLIASFLGNEEQHSNSIEDTLKADQGIPPKVL